MTGTQLQQLTEDILDGIQLDEDFFLQLLNIAKVNLEDKRVWQYLKKLNSSNTGTTAAISLPADFSHDYKVLVGTTEYFPLEFEEQHLFEGASHRYYIDLANSQYYLKGNPRPDTIYFYYKRFTDDITASTSPVFPSRFHPLLAYYVAGYYQAGIDADDIFARMSPENKIAAGTLERTMLSWDTELKLRSQNGRIGVSNSEPVTDLSQM